MVGAADERLAALDCECLELAGGQRIFQLERNEEGDLIAFCQDEIELEPCEEEESACGDLPLVCGALPVLSRFGPWDVDLDGDGLGDDRDELGGRVG